MEGAAVMYITNSYLHKACFQRRLLSLFGFVTIPIRYTFNP